MWLGHVECKGYLLAVEEADVEGFLIKYVLIYDNSRLILVTPLFITDFNMCLALDGFPRKLLHRTQRVFSRFMVFKTVFVGGLSTQRNSIAIDCEYKKSKELLSFFDNTISNYAKKVRASLIVIKDIDLKQRDSLSFLQKKSYICTEALPGFELPIPFVSLNEYLQSLSRSMRKNLKRKEKECNDNGSFDVVVTSDISDLASDVSVLYHQTFSHNDLQFEILTEDYFKGVSRYLSERAIFFLYYTKDEVDKKLIGFNLCLKGEGELLDKYFGMDQVIGRKYNLYFMSFLYNVKWCIENGYKKYSLNAGSDEIKIRLGAKPEQRYHLTRCVQPQLHFFVVLCKSLKNYFQ